MERRIPEWIMATSSIAGVVMGAYSINVANSALNKAEEAVSMEKASANLDRLPGVAAIVDEYFENYEKRLLSESCGHQNDSDQARNCHIQLMLVTFSNLKSYYPEFFSKHFNKSSGAIDRLNTYRVIDSDDDAKQFSDDFDHLYSELSNAYNYIQEERAQLLTAFEG